VKTITGTFLLPDGTPAVRAVLELALSKSATVIANSAAAPQLVCITLDGTGSIPAGTQIYANDELSPAGTTYTLHVINDGAQVLYGPESFPLTGASPIAINSHTPALRRARGKLCPYK
jgi:hypothetical protein